MICKSHKLVLESPCVRLQFVHLQSFCPSSSLCCVSPCSLQQHWLLSPGTFCLLFCFMFMTVLRASHFFFFFLQGGDSEHSMLEVKNISSFHRRVPHFNQAFCSLRAADGATSSTSTEHLFLSCELKAREPSGHQHCSVYFAI